MLLLNTNDKSHYVDFTGSIGFDLELPWQVIQGHLDFECQEICPLCTDLLVIYMY